MECPKCRKTVKDDDYICPYCGTNIKSAPESKKTAKVKPHKKKEKAKNDTANAETTEETLKKKRSLRQIFKLAAIIVCVVLIIILVITVISSVISSKGEKYAQTAAEYIGSSLKTLESEEDITYKDESSYYGVNSAVEYDYVLEADSEVKANGVKYPEWAVFIDMSDSSYVESVRYTDFTVLKNDIRGQKNDKLITLDSFVKGDKQSAVMKMIDVDPYSIEYTEKGYTIYTYRYYYERDNSDEQQVILRVAFNKKGKYQYYTSELVYPYDL